MTLAVPRPHHLASVCDECGYWKECRSPGLLWELDNRSEAVLREKPYVLVLGPKPSEYDDEQGRVLSPVTQGNRLVRKFLDHLEARWIIDNGIRCYVPQLNRETIPIRNLNYCNQAFLTKLVAQYNPRVVVCMGEEAARAIFGSKPPSVTNTRHPVPWPGREGCWVLLTPSPNLHLSRYGKDLREEYYRVFSKAEKIALYGTQKHSIPIEVIRTPEHADVVLSNIPLGIWMAYDVETAVHKKVQAKATIWHPKARMLSAAISWQQGSKIQTVVFTPEVLSSALIRRIASGRKILGHNLKYEEQASYRFYNVSIFKLAEDIDDTMADSYLPDQERVGNGLKKLCQEHRDLHAWDQEIRKLETEVKSQWEQECKLFRKINGQRKRLLDKFLKGETQYRASEINPETGRRKYFLAPLPSPEELEPVPLPDPPDYGDIPQEPLYCVDPETLVLTSNLEWKAARKIQAGDTLIGFDEESEGLGGRKLRTSLVESVAYRKLPKVLVQTDKGNIIVSSDHRFLANRGNTNSFQGWQWKKISDLKPGKFIAFLGSPWHESKTYEAGYLAGILDGEGCLNLRKTESRGRRSGHITIAQKYGPTLDRIEFCLTSLGIKYSREFHREDVGYLIISNFYDVWKCLGAYKPYRLLDKAIDAKIWEGFRPPCGRRMAKILEIHPYDESGYVVSIQTSTKTLFTDGFFSHNCYNGTDTYGTLDLKLNYFNKLPEDQRPHPSARELYKRSMVGLSRVEQVGLPMDADYLRILGHAHTHRYRSIQKVLLEQPEVQDALLQLPGYHSYIDKCNKRGYLDTFELLDFIKPKGEKFLQALAEKTVGTENFPRTKEGKMSLKEADLLKVAALKKKGFVSTIPVEERTREQNIWRAVYLCRKSQDMRSKFCDFYRWYLVDGRVHMDFYLAKTEKSDWAFGADSEGGGAGTGRTASKPNTQNAIKDLVFRVGIRAGKGKLLMENDYDRIEPVVFSVVANIPLWKDIFRRKLDIYQINANKVCKLGIQLTGDDDKDRELLSQVPGELRDMMKILTLAVMYNMTARTFAAVAKITEGEAEKFLYDFHNENPEIVAYKEDCYARVREGRKIVTPFGRQRLYVLPTEKKFWNKVFRRAINFSIQGTASDITLWKLYEIIQWLDETGYWEYCKPCNVVHDSIWFEIDEEYVAVVYPEIKRIMEDMSTLPFMFDTPLGVSSKLCKDMGHMVEVKGSIEATVDKVVKLPVNEWWKQPEYAMAD